MEKTKILIIIALIIGVVALGISVCSYYTLGKKIEEMESAIAETKLVIEAIEPVIPQLEIINNLIPRMQQLLSGPSPVSP